MSGIAGFYSAAGEQAERQQSVNLMLGRMTRGAQGVPRQITAVPQATLAWFGREGQSASLPTAKSGSSAIVFDGELYGVARRRNPASTNNNASPADSDAYYLLQGYLQDGGAFLAGLEGRFSAAIWDGARNACALISDKFGTKPLYYHHGPERLAFASEIKALLTLPGLPRDLNQRGLIQFFAFGHLWNQDTFFSAVRCLDAATVAVFDANADKLCEQRYWRPRATAQRDVAASLSQLDSQLKAAIDDRTLDAERLGISLSGGLDARTILGLMDHVRAPSTCVSLGMEGSLDQRSAQRLAELAGCEYHTLVLDQGFLANFERHLEDMVDLTDGHYLSQCIVMPTLPLYQKLGIRTLLRGHAGELVHMHKAYNFSVDASIREIYDQHMLHEWLFPRLQSHLTDGVDEQLICGVGQHEFEAAARETLRLALDDTAHWDHPVDRISQVFLDQRTRRETAMSLVKFESVVDLRLPYLDGRFVEAVFAAPPELRIGEAIQTHMLEQRRPDFLRPVNSNTGAPVNAAPLRRWFGYNKMRVLAKLGVRGYQPYERLGLWLRRELRPVVERILLSPECLDRGLLEPDAIRNVVKRHFAGEQNHTFLLMAMMILETGLGRMLDEQHTISADHANYPDAAIAAAVAGASN